MDMIDIPAGSEVMIGAPARPMAPPLVASIARLVAEAGFSEAHLPLCYAQGVIDKPRLVLVLVTPRALDADRLAQLRQGLEVILPAGESLDVLSLAEGSELLPAVRASGCRLSAGNGTSARKGWWPFGSSR